MIETITDIYCKGISEPIPWAGTAAEFEERRPGVGGTGDRIMRWSVDGRNVVLDLNETSVVAMVERWAPAS